MKKDKEWLKEQIKHEEVDLKYAFDNYVPYEKVLIADDVNELLNELEEPEQEKVVVPQFVGERIKEYKEIEFGISLIFMINRQIDEDVEFSKWISSDKDNCDKVARAWLDGYSVEKQKLYYVRENNYLLCKYNDEVIDYVEAVEREITDLVKLKLTEQEIKDYDERFWSFAEEITK